MNNKPIKNRFLYFKSFAAFLELLDNGKITNDHIAVVQDVENNPDGSPLAKLYMHGHWINGARIPADIDYQNLVLILYSYGMPQTMVWS